MADRVSAWREVCVRAISREEHGTTITATYPSDPALIRRLRELIAAEAECCSFLTFTLEEGPREAVLHLEFPEQARPLIGLIAPASAST
ncbi:MAG TPA: hypothetical protein VIG64_05880 [Actinomycetota bacterium]|jgi:hypothetical protein